MKQVPQGNSEIAVSGSVQNLSSYAAYGYGIVMDLAVLS